jgi:hypothetical protein
MSVHVQSRHTWRSRTDTSAQVKVENDLFYQACDQLGLLVIQDMPSLRPSQSRTLANCTTQTILPDADQQAEFQRQLEVMINQHKSYTSIFTWASPSTPFSLPTTKNPSY